MNTVEFLAKSLRLIEQLETLIRYTKAKIPLFYRNEKEVTDGMTLAEQNIKAYLDRCLLIAEQNMEKNGRIESTIATALTCITELISYKLGLIFKDLSSGQTGIYDTYLELESLASRVRNGVSDLDGEMARRQSLLSAGSVDNRAILPEAFVNPGRSRSAPGTSSSAVFSSHKKSVITEKSQYTVLVLQAIQSYMAECNSITSRWTHLSGIASVTALKKEVDDNPNMTDQVLQKKIQRLCENSGGSTLKHFTSVKELQTVSNVIDNTLDK